MSGRLITRGADDVNEGDTFRWNPFFDKFGEYHFNDTSAMHLTMSRGKEFKNEKIVGSLYQNGNIRNGKLLVKDEAGIYYVRESILVKGVDYT